MRRGLCVSQVTARERISQPKRDEQSQGNDSSGSDEEEDGFTEDRQRKNSIGTAVLGGKPTGLLSSLQRPFMRLDQKLLMLPDNHAIRLGLERLSAHDTIHRTQPEDPKHRGTPLFTARLPGLASGGRVGGRPIPSSVVGRGKTIRQLRHRSIPTGPLPDDFTIQRCLSLLLTETEWEQRT